MPNSKPKKKSEQRKRNRVIPVRVTQKEFEIIQSKAGQCSSHYPSTYLRDLGLGKRIKSTIDGQVILELAKLRAELGRIGGLVKAWLSPKQKDMGNTPETKEYLDNNKADLKNLLRDLEFNISIVEDKVKKI